LILTSTQVPTSSEDELKINISSLPAGYYMARIRSGSIEQTLKFVKQ
jgi:hypothetical protein